MNNAIRCFNRIWCCHTVGGYFFIIFSIFREEADCDIYWRSIRGKLMPLLQKTIREVFSFFAVKQSEPQTLPKWNRRRRFALNKKEALIALNSLFDSTLHQFATDSLATHIMTHFQDS